MALGPKTQDFFKKLSHEINLHPTKPLATIEIAEFRQTSYQNFKEYSEVLDDAQKKNFTKHILPLKDNVNAQILIYTPANIKPPYTTIILFPGGGFLLNLIEAHLSHVVHVANQANCQAIIVDYPLAPEFTSQQIFNYCYNVTMYLYFNNNRFQIDRERIIIEGISAGGNIAANIVNQSLVNNEMKFAQQILISPWLDISLEVFKNTPYTSFQDEDIMLSRDVMEYLQKHYLRTDEDPKSPYISPYYYNHESLKFMPPTIIVGEYDALRGDSEAYYEKLCSSGIQVQKIVCKGQTHNCTICRKILNDGVAPADLVASNLIR